MEMSLHCDVFKGNNTIILFLQTGKGFFPVLRVKKKQKRAVKQHEKYKVQSLEVTENIHTLYVIKIQSENGLTKYVISW